MTEENTSGSHRSTPAEFTEPYDSGSISLRPVVQTLKQYRSVIGVGLVVGILLFSIVGLFLYLSASKRTVSSLRFRLEFDGIDQNRYPSGLKFSSSEITSPPVLTKVYEANQLKDFLTFPQFRNAVFVLESSPALSFLDQEYQSRLSDPRLTPVERERIESEYFQKKQALGVSEFALTFVHDHTLFTVPPVVVSKALDSILATWAQQAVQSKGALKYQVSVLSKNIIHGDFEAAEDYLIGVDILRTKIKMVLNNIDELLDLPGATVRLTPAQISLAEVRSNLEDTRSFKLQPLLGMIRDTHLTKNPRASVAYFENRLFQLKLEHEHSERKVITLQNALLRYSGEQALVSPESSRLKAPTGESGMSGLIPQFSESFLDRLIQLSAQKEELAYRQEMTEQIIEEGFREVSLRTDIAHYQDLLDLAHSLPPQSAVAGIREERAANYMKMAEAVLQDILLALDQMNLIYEELSAQNLGPETSLYIITSPMITNIQRSIMGRTLVLYALLVVLGLIVILPTLALSHAFVSRGGSLRV